MNDERAIALHERLLGNQHDAIIAPLPTNACLPKPGQLPSCSYQASRPPGKELRVGEAEPMARTASRKAVVDFDPRVFLTKLGSGKTVRDYRPRQAVFSQGDPADAVFYVLSGKVKLTVLSTHGKQAVIAILEPGNSFGEGCLASQPLRMSTANAIEPSAILRVSKEAMVALLHREPEVAELFIAYLL